MNALQSIELPPRFGPYRIVCQLGQGGMGTVFLAEDTRQASRRALKVARYSVRRSESALERLFREAEIVRGIRHPSICPVYEAGTISSVPYFTMEFIQGRPLSACVNPQKPVSESAAATLMATLARAVGVLHRAGVIHRDLKPSNILMRTGRDPVIVDFGLAQGFDTAEREARAGRLMGTLAFMAPELSRADGQEVGPGCDIYSLGVMLYALLTGRRPFGGPTAAMLNQILIKPVPPPSVHRHDLARALDDICLQAMARDLRERYASADAFASALEELLAAGELRDE